MNSEELLTWMNRKKIKSWEKCNDFNGFKVMPLSLD
jgi:hypothetical protein